MNIHDGIILGLEIVLIILSGLFGLVLLARYKLIQTVAQQNLRSYSKKYINQRIIFQCLNILSYTTLIVLQFLQIDFIGQTINSDGVSLFALLWLVPIVISIFQIYIEIQEFKSKIPINMYHKIYWIIQLVISVSVLLVCITIPNDNEQHYYLKIFVLGGRATFQLLLILYFWYRKQDIQEFMQLSNWIWGIDVNSMKKPLMEYQIYNERNSEPRNSENEINVKFDPNFKLKNQVIQFKMKVILDPRRSVSGTGQFSGGQFVQSHSNSNTKEYYITKELSDFQQLQEDIDSEIRNDGAVTESSVNEIQQINIQYQNHNQYDYGYFQDLKSKLAEFINILCSNPSLYYDCFLDFLNVTEIDLKHYYLSLKNYDPRRHQNGQFDLRKEDSNQNQSCSFSNERLHTEYFEIIFDQIKDINIDHVKYQIKIINLQNKASMKFQMRYKELRQLNGDLKQHFRSLPPFPQKKIISTTNPTFLNERINQLKLYMSILLNEDEYLKGDILSSALKPFTQKYNPRVWQINPQQIHQCNYSAWTAESCGNFIQMINGENKGFTVYKFNIYENVNKRGQIEKRFKEFVKLHEFIEQKFSNQVENLPKLPPKVSNFNTNIPKEKRQKDLQEYLNKLFKINNIGQCFFFRQFFVTVSQPLETINFSSPKFVLPSLNNPDQNSEINANNSLKQSDIFEEPNYENQDKNSVNSVKIDGLKQYAGKISPTTNIY